MKTKSIPLALLTLLLIVLTAGCKAKSPAEDATTVAAPATASEGVRVEHDQVGVDLADAGITAKVKAGLATDSRVSALKIDVDTKAGVVTLKGSVDAPAARQAAEEIARGTAGVKNVVDQLTVQGT
ncbi:MAG: hyperosmotically inducible periplasmic protein [Acidobacteriota bacterium]|jgi:osmotically-inducible protein OsmY|nr:hyperosmotically inducible periplasmic protein [Acidobacteriota bacterium]